MSRIESRCMLCGDNFVKIFELYEGRDFGLKSLCEFYRILVAQNDAADKVSKNNTNLQIERVFVNTDVFK